MERHWAVPSHVDRAGCHLCTGVGVVVCVGGAIASLDGEADLILPLLFLLLQLLLILEGTGLHGVFRSHLCVVTCPVLLQGRTPLWM